jgi:Flp pilus assembly protein TadG
MKTLAMLRRVADRTASILGDFRRNRRGLAAVEFALVLPVGLALFTGAVIYGDAIAIDRKVTLTTRTVTDLVTQYATISKSDLDILLGASAQILSPYSSANAVVIVSQVQVDASGTAKIAWSRSLPIGNEETPGSTATTLPINIKIPGAYYIWGEVRYTYTPAIGYMVTGPIVLHDQTYMSPRVATSGIPAPQ